MRLGIGFAAVLAAIALVVGGNVASAGAVVGDCTPQPSWGTLQPSVEAQVIQLVNAHRVAIGLNALTPAPSLVASAEWKSLNEAGYQYMAHDDPAPVSRTVSDRLAACGYPTNAAWGENIAYGFLDAQSVMDAWLSDSGHKANIENTSWTTIGVGVAQASNGLIFWTQDFGTTGTSTTPPPNDTQAPSVPTGLTANGTSKTTVNFSWKPSSDDNGVAGYDVYLNGTLLGTTGVTTGTIGGLQCGTTYTLGVDAYDLSGNKSAIATISVSTQPCSPQPPPPPPDTQAPSAPAGLTATGAGQTSVDLAWQAASDDTGVAGYGLYVDGDTAGAASGTTATITGLACGTTYTVAVDAFDAAGNRSTAAEAAVTTAACPPPDVAPTTPTGLVVTAASRQAVRLDWDPATDDVRVKGYTVYVDGVAVKTTGPNWTSARTNGLDCGTTYTVGVDAFDADGNHSAMATMQVTTNDCRQY